MPSTWAIHCLHMPLVCCHPMDWVGNIYSSAQSWGGGGYMWWPCGLSRTTSFPFLCKEAHVISVWLWPTSSKYDTCGYVCACIWVRVCLCVSHVLKVYLVIYHALATALLLPWPGFSEADQVCSRFVSFELLHVCKMY